MAKATFPEFKLPELKLPKIDLDALFSLQKANLAVAQETQSVVLEAVQAIVRLQHGYANEVVETLKGVASAKTPAKPEAVLADVQAATQKAVAVAKQGVDLGVAAQQRVVELVSQRVKANVDELKAIAA
ncbi:MAG: phasin family protein [Geminicoccaceae bacterium]